MSDYLIHYNKNHSKANGQFVSGDGDGDGISNDHKNQKKERSLPSRAEARRSRNYGIAMMGLGTAMETVGWLGNKYFYEVDDNIYAQGASFALQCAAIPTIAIGAVKTVKGSVNMGKASRRGDMS